MGTYDTVFGSQPMGVAEHQRSGTETSTCDRLTASLRATLSELREVLRSLPQETYHRSMGSLFANATIGGHVRHCLDHVRSLVNGLPDNLVNYDQRVRGTMIESEVSCALRELDDLLLGLIRMSDSGLDGPISVSIMPSRDGVPALVQSTLSRELAFVLSHTIHHHATIRGMVVADGRSVPESFGYAPSTLAHKDGCTCAP